MAAHTAIKHPDERQQLTELPVPLLELILIKGTNTKGKKSLRQTCKCFQQLLDDNIACIKLEFRKKEIRPCSLLKRMQHMQGLKTLVIKDMTNVHEHLPGHITTLTIQGDSCPSLRALKQLQCLTALNIEVAFPSTYLEGLADITGLTTLHLSQPAGCIAHLAPTLKRLSIWSLDDLQGVEQLTNLEALKLMYDMPHSFFEIHSRLPLEHLFVGGYIIDASCWQSAPTTLTRLTLHRPGTSLPDLLPATITHLQLLDACYQNIQQTAASLPALSKFDVYLTVWPWNSAFGNLSKLTNLDTLGICVRADVVASGRRRVPWHREQVIAALPEVAKMIEKGVRLNVVAHSDEFLDVFGDPCKVQSEWTMQE